MKEVRVKVLKGDKKGSEGILLEEYQSTSLLFGKKRLMFVRLDGEKGKRTYYSDDIRILTK